MRLQDVARVELGLQSYGQRSTYNGKPAAGFGVQLASGANAIYTAEAVHAELDRLAGSLPEGVTIGYSYDTTPFVELSIEKVVETLIEAIVLVFIVMLLFLQNLRATLIPMIAVPVVLLGTFGMLAVFGYSINTLTMFAMVLAIGLLVDDAIVVVENVERVMADEGLSPHEATRKSMGEITGALIGIALVLSAVFVPMAFFSRLGRRHLPAVLDHHRHRHGALGARRHHPDARALRDDAEAHDHGGGTSRSSRLVQPRLRQDDQRLCRGRRPGSCGARCAVLHRLRRPDRGGLAASIPAAHLLPAGRGPGRADHADLSCPRAPMRTARRPSLDMVEDYLWSREGHGRGVFTTLGFSFGGSGPERRHGLRQAQALRGAHRRQRRPPGGRRARHAPISARSATPTVFALAPPAIQGLGQSERLRDLLCRTAATQGTRRLIAAANQLARSRPAGQRSVGNVARQLPARSKPQLKIDIDQEKAGALALDSPPSTA